MQNCNEYIHNLKNRLNAVKLYATLLKNRIDKRAASNNIADDEVEIIDALIEALGSTTRDLNFLESYQSCSQ